MAPDKKKERVVYENLKPSPSDPTLPTLLTHLTAAVPECANYCTRAPWKFHAADADAISQKMKRVQKKKKSKK